VDTRFKTSEDFNKYDPEEERRATDDVNKFLSEMRQTDAKLQAAAQSDESGNKENFNSQQFLTTLQVKKTAEESRLKGNEFMKSKEFDAAIECYTKSTSKLNAMAPAFKTPTNASNLTPLT
jgi:hypothetical protein